MRLTVIGSGYVGLVSAACFAEIGHDVVSVDSDVAKIAALESGIVPIHEPLLSDLLNRHRSGRLKFSTSVEEAVKGAEAIFITVGTPQSKTGEADLFYVEAVTHEIATAISTKTLIVEKSTVPVRTCESLRKALLLNHASLELFSVASNPEFLREGTAVTDFLYPDRIVVGADDDFAASMLQTIYKPLTDGSYYLRADAVKLEKISYDRASLIITTANSAELIKHASNAFLAMKISFINAVANISERVGADIEQVCAGIGSDSRIGSRFLRAGIGYGGSCFPKDVQAFYAVAAECGYNFGLLNEVTNINVEQRNRFLRKVKTALWTLRGKQIGVLGMAFKGDTDDIRESPAIAIIEALISEGARVRAYDPAAMERAKETLPHLNVQYVGDPYEVASNADALLFLTDWREFELLDLARLHSLLKYPIVIDGRNLFKPELMANAGLIYHSVGRSTVTPAPNHAAISDDRGFNLELAPPATSPSSQPSVAT